MPKKASITGKPKQNVRIRPGKSRKIINQFHTLQKRKAQIERQIGQIEQGEQIGGPGLSELRKSLAQADQEILNSGGLEIYQKASISGQSAVRGGDSSKVLTKWLNDSSISTDIRSFLATKQRGLLEVGSLDPLNDVSTSGLFCRVDRIDLNSQNPRIQQQDFMQRPVPKRNEDRYDVLSLSLVLNYVPDALQRGEMLKHTARFLQPDGLLFFVLPKPCIENSRYCTQDLLEAILAEVGYSVVERKFSSKIAYWLLKLNRLPAGRTFAKQLVNDGPKRNNFHVVLG